MHGPDYQRDGITLYCGDCLEILPELSGFDAVVTDPPYGIDYHPAGGSGLFGKRTYTNEHRIIGDAVGFDPSHLLEFGVPSVLFGANHYANRIPSGGRWLVWDKRDGCKSDRFSDCEIAWCSSSGQDRVFSHIWKGGIRASEHGKKWHPSQKPICVMAWCLSFVVNARVVLDPYMGSGTTALACIEAGVDFIGVEKDPAHFHTAIERIDAALDADRDSLWTAKELAKETQPELFT